MVVRPVCLLAALLAAPLAWAGLPPIADRITDEELAEARRPLPPMELKGGPETRDLDVRGNDREVWERVVAAYGLDVVFDPEYEPIREVRVQLREADYREALRVLEATTSSFLVPVSDRLGLVARDTQQKRQDLEHTMAVTIPIPNPVTMQEAQEMARSVQQLMEIQKFAVDGQQRLVLVRDRVGKVRATMAIFEQMLRHPPEISIEVEFLELSQKSSLSYGLSLPNLFPLVWLGDHPSFVTQFPAGFTNFLAFGGGLTQFGLGLTSAEMFASMSRSDARTWMRAELRTLNNQAANFHLGDKYPVLVSGFFGGPADPELPVYTPPPTVNFEDLGVVLKVTPRVHDMQEVTLEVEAEFKVLTGNTLNGIPVIANRKFTSQVRLRFDQSAVMSGLVRRTELENTRGIAGLARLPLIGWLFRENQKDRDTAETLILLKPKLLSLPLSEVVTRGFWTGTETKPRSRL